MNILILVNFTKLTINNRNVDYNNNIKFTFDISTNYFFIPKDFFLTTLIGYFLKSQNVKYRSMDISYACATKIMVKNLEILNFLMKIMNI